MDLLTLLQKFKDFPSETIGIRNDANLSYTNINTLKINSDTYTHINRICLINTDDGIKLYVTQYQNKKVTNKNISDINTLIVT